MHTEFNLLFIVQPLAIGELLPQLMLCVCEPARVTEVQGVGTKEPK